MNRKRIAIDLNLDWPIKRYHDLYKGIRHYSELNTDWIISWDHFPAYQLKNNLNKPYYDGVIGRIKKDTYLEAKKHNIPLVNTWLSNSIKDIPSIFPDYNKIVKKSANHLIYRGHKNIAFIGHKNEATTVEFNNSLMEVTKNNECSLNFFYFNRKVTEENDQWHKYKNQLRHWSDNWKFPLAIICSDSSVIPSLIELCQEKKVSIPDDLSIISLENEPLYCESHWPLISSIDIDYYKMGIEAAKMMEKQLKGKKLVRKKELVQPEDLIARDSTDSFAVNDECIKQSLRYILDNINNNLHVGSVVNQVPISRRTLELKFKKELGYSILEAIQRLRIDIAKRMLVESNDKVLYIQKFVGFTTPLQMRRVFSKYTGMSPREYRRKCVNN